MVAAGMRGNWLISGVWSKETFMGVGSLSLICDGGSGALVATAAWAASWSLRSDLWAWRSAARRRVRFDMAVLDLFFPGGFGNGKSSRVR